MHAYKDWLYLPDQCFNYPANIVWLLREWDNDNNYGGGMDLFSQADRAALRRGTDPWEVKGFYELLKKYPDFNKKFLADSAPLLAEIRTTNQTKLGRACKNRLTERRFRRLLQSRNRDDLVHQLRGVVRILNREANPDELVEIVQYWGEIMRRKIAQDYFGSSDDAKGGDE